MIVDKTRNEAIILGTSQHAGTRKSNLWLWKIDPNGTVTNNKSLGPLSEYNSFIAKTLLGIKATVKQDTGDIVILKLDDVNSMSLSVTNRNMQSSAVKLNTSARKLPGTLILHDMISYQNDNLLIVGQSGKDGIVMRTNMAGNVIWEKTFDLRQLDILSGVACDLNGTDFYVVGISGSMAGKMQFAGVTTVSVLCYDGDGKLKASDSFEGGTAPWPKSLPKVIRFPSGVVLVVYDKSVYDKSGIATELYAKAYTRELTPLWEKQILQTKKGGPPASFDICVTPEDHFVLAGQVNYSDLRVYEYKADGTILQTLELNGDIGAGVVYVDYLPGKILVTYTAKSKENTRTRQIKLLAVKPYKTN